MPLYIRQNLKNKADAQVLFPHASALDHLTSLQAAIRV